jgi:hypothetical protein
VSTLAERMAELQAEQPVGEAMTLKERMDSLEQSGSQGKRGTMSAPPSKESELSFLEQVGGGLRGVGQGLTLNAADEISSGLATVGRKAENFITGGDDDRGFRELYDATMAESKGRREAFAEAEPVIDLTSNVGGALVGGGLTGAKMLSMQVIKNAPKLAKAIAASTTGSIEGMIAGFNSGDSLEERVDRGKTGGLLGAAIPAALSTAGALTRGASNRFKIDNEIEVLDGVQQPLNLANPNGARGKTYRDVVGNAIGGRSVYDNSQPFINRAQAVADEKAARVAQVAVGARNVTDAVNKRGGFAVSQTKQAGKEQVDNAVQARKMADSNATNLLNSTFRKDMTDASLPANFSDEGRRLLADPNVNPTTKMDRIAREWTENGFKSVKGVTFDIDRPTFQRQMKGLFDNDPSLDTKAGEYMTAFSNRLDKAYNQNTRQMAGADLMELRNQYARSANKTADATERQVFRTIANKVDDLMLENMPDGSRAAFAAEKKAYDTSLILDKSTGSAASKKAGEFTPDEWLAATPKQRRGKGRGPEQETATNVQAQINAIKEAQAGALKNLPERQVAKNADAVAKENFSLSKKAAKDRTEKVAATAKEGLTQAKQKVSDIKFNTPQDKPSLATRMIATGMMSTPLAPDGITSSQAIGALTAKLASNNTFQRVLAGQSLDKTLNKLGGASVGGLSLADILRQGTAAGVVQGRTQTQE